MPNKNLIGNPHNFSICTNIISNNSFIKCFRLLLVVIICLVMASYLISRLNLGQNQDISAGDFRFDVNMLTETANTIEAQKKVNGTLALNDYGTDGKIINNNKISSSLKAALSKITDENNDGTISNEELASLQIMGLNQEEYKKELEKLQFNLISSDRNLNHYVIITKGKFAGTILYNGPLKFKDSENKTYLGLELFN